MLKWEPLTEALLVVLACLCGMGLITANVDSPSSLSGGCRSPAVACWISDHWVASSNPLRDITGVCLAQFSLNNVHKRGLKHHHFIRRELLLIQYALKLKCMPKHPTHKSICQPKYSTQFADNPSAIPTFGIRINKLLQDVPIIELRDIADDQKPEPVWTINQPVILGIKREIHPTNFMS